MRDTHSHTLQPSCSHSPTHSFTPSPPHIPIARNKRKITAHGARLRQTLTCSATSCAQQLVSSMSRTSTKTSHRTQSVHTRRLCLASSLLRATRARRKTRQWPFMQGYWTREAPSPASVVPAGMPWLLACASSQQQPNPQTNVQTSLQIRLQTKLRMRRQTEITTCRAFATTRHAHCHHHHRHHLRQRQRQR